MNDEQREADDDVVRDLATEASRRWREVLDELAAR